MSDIIILKTDPKLKARAQKVAADLGLTLTAVINKYLNDFVQRKIISFSKGKRNFKDPYGIFAGSTISEKEIDKVTKSWMKTIDEIG